MTIIEAIILGIIQGLTEFLPVSSSGHIELGKAILGVQPKDPLLFSIVVHGATALSTMVIFRGAISDILRDLVKFKKTENTLYAGKIGLSMIPVLIVGLLLEDKIEALFEGKILLVGLMLLLTGFLLWATTIAKEKTGEISFGKAVIVGIAQAVAILPGISRSGATISTSLLLGINREKAARFSFLMVLPPIIGAMILKMKDYSEITETTTAVSTDISTITLVFGFIAAFVAGLFACRWMIHLVQRSKLIYFAYYCFLVGAIAIGYALLY